jgi:[NiFe] hydrogenase assembly HybE family chaperone
MNSDTQPLVRSRQADGVAAAPSAAPAPVEPAACSLPDPSPRLVTAFQAVAVRMAGLSFVNPALAVEAVGFAPWQGYWLGVMLTPWFMNLILAPRDAAAWRSLEQGGKRRYRFPAGDYDFIGARDELAGEYQLCSLFSPVLQFEDQDSARLVAQLAREALFDATNAEPHAMPAANLSPLPVPRAADPGPLEKLHNSLDAPQSKRDFLHGRWTGGDRGHRG